MLLSQELALCNSVHNKRGIQRLHRLRIATVCNCKQAGYKTPRAVSVLKCSRLQATDTSMEATALPAVSEIATQIDQYGVQRLVYQTQGWNYWTWQGHKIHYIQAGSGGTPIVLVHGFGASAYHWRYNIPALSEHHSVYAVDMLGFGWSDKPVIDYYSEGSNVWSDQIGDFIREVVMREGGEKVVLVGNSLGGYNSLSAAAKYPDLVKGVVLLNGAGRFDVESPDATVVATPVITEEVQTNILRSWLDSTITSITASMKRLVLYITFQQTKQPARIKQVLESVYVSRNNIDDDLINSIVAPSTDPNAAEVFYRVISGRGDTVNTLLRSLQTPLFLLWGDQDPWIVPAKAQQIKRLYPEAEIVGLPSGHCPHDDTPDLVNKELLKWVNTL